jgi:hypothetical protein
MPHLPADRLAALADEAPTPAELAHLEGCAACREEREAHGRLRTLAAGAWARVAPPITSWDAIAGRLRDEGIVVAGSADVADDPGMATGPGWRRAAWRWGARAASALLLLGGGVAAGRYSAGASPLPPSLTALGGADLPAPSAPRGDTEGNVSGAPADSVPAFRSQAEALAALARAERQYQLAATFLVQHDPEAAPLDDSSAVYRTRLAALDDVTAIAREALYEAPYDPVISRYYLATMSAREATLRQLNTALPEGRQLTRF